MAGDSRVDSLLRLVDDVRWPAAHRSDVRARRTYERGLDTAFAFRGDPQVYVEAFQHFQASQSCAYAFAGIAYTLMLAASWHSNELYRPGMAAAMEWLEKAQAWEPDAVAINFIEAMIYTNLEEYENARLVLDYLWREKEDSYYLHQAEIVYWYQQQEWEQHLSWVKRTRKLAGNPLRQHHVLSALGDHFLKTGRSAEAIRVYHEVVKVAPHDPWAWHNMSVLLLELGEYDNAEACCDRALELMDFPAARQVKEHIQGQRPGVNLRRLFGR